MPVPLSYSDRPLGANEASPLGPVGLYTNV